MTDLSAMLALAHRVRRGQAAATSEAKALANHVLTLAGRLEEMEAEVESGLERRLRELGQARERKLCHARGPADDTTNDTETTR